MAKMYYLGNVLTSVRFNGNEARIGNVNGQG